MVEKKPTKQGTAAATDSSLSKKALVTLANGRQLPAGFGLAERCCQATGGPPSRDLPQSLPLLIDSLYYRLQFAVVAVESRFFLSNKHARSIAFRLLVLCKSHPVYVDSIIATPDGEAVV